MTKVIINKWDTSMVNDSRDRRESACRVSTNFDAITNPSNLTPYRDSEDGDVGSETSKKQNFTLALRTGTTWSLYSLGVKSGAGTAEVLYKDLTLGAPNDLDDNTWSTPTNNQSSTGATKFDLFVFYKKTGLIYGARNNALWAFSPTGTAFDNTARSLTHTNIAEGLVHSKDDILYIPYDNKILKNNNGSWTDVAITIPDHFKINSIAEFGNFLAIGAAPLSGIGNSRVYLWDRDSSLTTLSENVDWGTGELKVLEEVDGFLVGISIRGGRSDTFKDRITFRYLLGNSGKKFNEMVTEGTSANLRIAKQKIDSRVYFMMTPTISGSLREGVWSFGRDTGTSFTINHERTPNNDTALTNGALHNFFIVGDFMFISYTDNAVKKVSKTNDQSSFTATSIRETTINPNMVEKDITKDKQITAVSLNYESLPTSGQVVLKYRVDGGSYITIFTETTDGKIKTEANVDTDKTNFKEGVEYEFRIESTGGAEIVELKYDYDIIATKI